MMRAVEQQGCRDAGEVYRCFSCSPFPARRDECVSAQRVHQSGGGGFRLGGVDPGIGMSDDGIVSSGA